MPMAFTVSLFGYESARGVAAATAVQIFLLRRMTLVRLELYFYLNLVKPGFYACHVQCSLKSFCLT